MSRTVLLGALAAALLTPVRLALLRRLLAVSLLSSLLLAVAPAVPAAGGDAGVAASQASPPHEAGVPRFPDVSATDIVFLFAGELWLVPRTGGLAKPLTKEGGPNGSPKFSPDGRTVAFTGSYDAIYTIPVSGGHPARVTHHPGATDLCGWTRDGRLLFMTDCFLPVGNFDGQARLRQLFTVAPTGGLPARLPLAYGAHGALSPDGRWLAYTLHAEGRREHRKMYQGGLAPDVWLLDLHSGRCKKISDWVGTDTAPLWHEDTLYYVSDMGSERRRNLWSYEIQSGRRRQVTQFKEYDVKWPSMGPGAKGHGEIVFVNGTDLYLLDLATQTARQVAVQIPEERRQVRRHSVDASSLVANWSLSPDGTQALVEARGDLWIISGEKGPARNITQTSGAAERDPSWSPDNQWIAYFSDASGEYELYIVRSEGKGAPRRLTKLGAGFRYRPVWSPDCRHIAFSDSSGGIFLHTVENAVTKRIFFDPWVRRPHLSWSPDSSWLAFPASVGKMQAIWLYDLEAGKAYSVTGGGYNDRWPTFDRRGDYLFFVTDRNFEPLTYDSIDYSKFVYPSTDLVMAVPLRADVGPPGRSPAQPAGEPPHAPAKRLRIDLEAFERRAVAVTSARGKYSNLAIGYDGQLVYTFAPPEGGPSVRMLDFADRTKGAKKEPRIVSDGTGEFRASADGKKLCVRVGSSLAIIDTAAGHKTGATITLAGMTVEVDPLAEWRQIFNEAWRIQRDFFYDASMRGVDWAGARTRYARLLEACASRDDLDCVIGEMVGELSSSHVYVNPPPADQPPAEAVGMLGVDYDLHQGAYRIVKIYDSASSDFSARNPLREPGVDVREGDHLLAVDGRSLDVRQDPWAAFKGLAGKDVTLTVSRKPFLDREAREVKVRPGYLEGLYRHGAWVEANRAHVEEKTDGRVGYVYLHMTSEYGLREFTRQFGPQRRKEALILDARWNQGGHIPFHLIDILNRRQVYFFSVDLRRGEGQRGPDYMVEGPRVLLTNGMTSSGGDLLAYMCRKSGQFKLIGTRTMGSMAGAGGVSIPFIDGGTCLPPTVGFYDARGRWIVEGRGVDPDIAVPDDSTETWAGRDPQLEAAITDVLQQLGKSNKTPGRRPGAPPAAGFQALPEKATGRCP